MLVVALAAIVALVLGGTGGQIAAWALDDRGASPSAPAAGAPVDGAPRAGASGPVALPEFSAEFPNPDQRYLPGVAVYQLTGMRMEEGITWDCGPTGGGIYTEAAQSMVCSTDPDLTFGGRLSIEYDEETRVTRVEAICQSWEDHGPGSVSAACRSIFAEVGAAAAGGQPDLAQQARDWAVQNMDSDSATTIGTIRIQVTLEPVAILLTPTA